MAGIFYFCSSGGEIRREGGGLKAGFGTYPAIAGLKMQSTDMAWASVRL